MIVKGRTRPLAICGHIQISDCVLRWARGTYLEERRLYSAEAEDIEDEACDIDNSHGCEPLGSLHLKSWDFDLGRDAGSAMEEDHGEHELDEEEKQGKVWR